MIKLDRNCVKAPKINKNYRTSKILTALGELCLNKCYLCETKFDNPQNMDVEHFVPYKDDNDPMKYEWTNLFLACNNCNNYKKTFSDNILNGSSNILAHKCFTKKSY